MVFYRLLLSFLCITGVFSAVTFTSMSPSDIARAKSSNSLGENSTRLTKNPLSKPDLVNYMNKESVQKNGPHKIEEKTDLNCNLDPETIAHIRSYQGVVNKIINYVVSGQFKGRTYDKLAELTDAFGSRMTGSKALENAVDWTISQYAQEGIEDVHTEYFEAPHWVRNKESLLMLLPRVHKMNLLGLGSSIGTPSEGITAQAFVVKSFEELEKYSEEIKGKIVVFNPTWRGYNDTVPYRVKGASEAAKHGAVAALVRSVTDFSINTAHTGWQRYDDEARKIPAACITTEDADMLHRFQGRGEKVFLQLKMNAMNYPPVTSRNVIAQIHGRTKPHEVIVVSGHLDSWDVGVGAMDDGGGAMISWVVPGILKNLNLIPKRTVRTVLFTGEEQGLWGGQAYFKRHSNSSHEKFQLLMESDGGTFTPLGVSFSGTNEATCIMEEVLALLEPINATKVIKTPLDGAPDLTYWKNAGFPTGGLQTLDDKYFWFHHTDGDTMAVQDPSSLDACAALWASVAYVVADMNITLPH